jgi:hypothetical protein
MFFQGIENLVLMQLILIFSILSLDQEWIKGMSLKSRLGVKTMQHQKRTGTKLINMNQTTPWLTLRLLRPLIHKDHHHNSQTKTQGV